MSFGPILFGFAVVPALLLIRSLQNMRRCLDRPEARRFVLVEMPCLILMAPIVITAFMSAEASFDPDFMQRSFVNPEGRGMIDIFFYSLDQTLRGAFFDIMETFQVSLSPLVHKCDSILFCSSMLIYRASVGIAASSVILSAMLIARSWFKRTE